ncbi:hypothetical protein C5167_049626 [Papaver somniferum]|uniref:Uncharacterized protein n=1 Tax=Papaver somniferum TaxID=3469 RepID=A0A4Y7KPU8_PAPSO|nr:hypothetical protein C5167_049626 [Papaver somniferum]
MRYARTTHKPQQRLSFSQVLHFFLQHILSSLESRDYQMVMSGCAGSIAIQLRLTIGITAFVEKTLQLYKTKNNFMCNHKCYSILYLELQFTFNILGWISERKRQKVHSGLQIPGP